MTASPASRPPALRGPRGSAAALGAHAFDPGGGRQDVPAGGRSSRPTSSALLRSVRPGGGGGRGGRAMRGRRGRSAHLNLAKLGCPRSRLRGWANASGWGGPTSAPDRHGPWRPSRDTGFRRRRTERAAGDRQQAERHEQTTGCHGVRSGVRGDREVVSRGCHLQYIKRSKPDLNLDLNAPCFTLRCPDLVATAEARVSAGARPDRTAYPRYYYPGPARPRWPAR
jgi:hypothetical protein